MCVVLTAMAIWTKISDEERTRQLMGNIHGYVGEKYTFDDDFVLIDVRTTNEYKLGHVEGAYNIPHERLEREIPYISPDKDRLILLYCSTGRKSGISKKMMEDIGYRRVVNLNELVEQAGEKK